MALAKKLVTIFLLFSIILAIVAIIPISSAHASTHFAAVSKATDALPLQPDPGPDPPDPPEPPPSSKEPASLGVRLWR